LAKVANALPEVRLWIAACHDFGSPIRQKESLTLRFAPISIRGTAGVMANA
jgi:hypothetical protein